MDILELAGKLDSEFDIPNHQEDLVAWAVTDENKSFINPGFLDKKTALFTKNSDKIGKVFTVVFITDEIVNKISKEKNCLIITHHHFNYFEDERGLMAIHPTAFLKLQENDNSIYVAHAPLDTHKKYGTSISLANLCHISVEKLFFDYFGAPTALIGKIEKTTFENFSSIVQDKLERPTLTKIKYKDFIEKIAVIGGAGDDPTILQFAHDKGCDTILTGTIEHRWAASFIQEGNKIFHNLNEELQLNLIGGTHYGTERPAMINLLELIKSYSIDCEYCEDLSLLKAI
jgi:putative NIF3 family GTP cyclohydrolase 1 type 2